MDGVAPRLFSSRNISRLPPPCVGVEHIQQQVVDLARSHGHAMDGLDMPPQPVAAADEDPSSLTFSGAMVWLILSKDFRPHSMRISSTFAKEPPKHMAKAGFLS